MGADHTSKTLFSDWMVIVCSIYTFGSGLGIPSSLSVMFLDWQDAFQVTRAHTAAVHSICFSIVLGGAVFAGYLMNRIGARLTILTGSFLATAGMFASAFATSINFLIVSVGVVSGFGFCCVQLPVIPCVTSVTNRCKGVVISLCMVSVAVVGIVNRYLLRHIIQQYSWRGACMVVAGLILQTSVGGMIITAKVKLSQESLVERDSEDRDGTSPRDVESNRRDMSPTIHINGSTSSLKPAMEDKEFQDEVYQIKECDAVCVKVATSPSGAGNGYSIHRSQITVVENNAIFAKNGGDGDDNVKIIAENNSKYFPHKWRFFCDKIFVLLSIHISACVAPLYSFCLILMDFARTLDFDESTGLTFLTASFAASIIGRLSVGVVSDLFREIPSILIQTVVAVPGFVAMLLLSFITERTVVICLLVLVGVSVGGLVTIYPKCALDIKSVDIQAYPIALGFFCSMEGTMTLVFAIAISLAVDMTESYTFILVFMGCLGLSSTFMLGCGCFYSRRQLAPSHNRHIKQRQEKNDDVDGWREHHP